MRRLNWESFCSQAYMVVGRIWVLQRCWTESLSSLLSVAWKLPFDCCQMGLSIEKHCILHDQRNPRDKETERVKKVNVTIIYKPLLKVIFHHFAIISSVNTSHEVQPTMQGRLHIRLNARREGSLREKEKKLVMSFLFSVS